MPDTKLSALTEVTTLADTDEIYVNDAGVSKRITKANLAAGITDENFTTADHAKLDGIEAGATADQSDAEIETAYNTQVAIVPQAEAEAGTATTSRRWNALRVAQAIAALGGGGSGDLKADGTVPLTANWDVGAFTITGTQFISDIATGTAPFVVSSTTEVANLKAATATLADTVTTNANLTGHVTSVGNAAVLGSFTKAQLSTAVSDGTVLYSGDVTSNATHTGEVTGSTALTVDPSAISNKTLVTVAATDSLLVLDDSDSPNTLKKIVASDFATAAQGTTADAALPKAGGEMTGNITFAASSPVLTVDGRDLSADGAKLDGIEAAADVTDATNVAAAGAVMADGTGNDITGDIVMTEKADHSSTPGAGKGYLWTKNTIPSTVIFTDDAGTDHDLTAGGGWADMTEAVWAGGTQSEVADGATAVAFDFNTDNAYSTAGAKLASFKNNATEKFAINKDGHIIVQTADDFKMYIGSTLYMHIKDGGANTGIAIGQSATATNGAGVAIGESATTGGGQNAVAIGEDAWAGQSLSIAIGDEATANKQGSIALGSGGNWRGSIANHHCGLAISGHEFSAQADNQFLLWQPANTTTNATPAELFMDEDGAANRMDVASGKMFAFEAHVVGVQSDGTDASYFTRKGIIANNAGTTALIGSVGTIGTDIESNASTDVSITADDTNDSLKIEVTGIAAETWRWSANVFVKDITIGT